MSLYSDPQLICLHNVIVALTIQAPTPTAAAVAAPTQKAARLSLGGGGVPRRKSLLVTKDTSTSWLAELQVTLVLHLFIYFSLVLVLVFSFVSFFEAVSVRLLFDCRFLHYYFSFV